MKYHKMWEENISQKIILVDLFVIQFQIHQIEKAADLWADEPMND